MISFNPNNIKMKYKLMRHISSMIWSGKQRRILVHDIIVPTMPRALLTPLLLLLRVELQAISEILAILTKVTSKHPSTLLLPHCALEDPNLRLLVSSLLLLVIKIYWVLVRSSLSDRCGEDI